LPYPTISQREAETSTTVRDGDSFVTGGLTQESSISSRSKIELYIVMTPHIVHRVAPLDRASARGEATPQWVGGALMISAEKKAGIRDFCRAADCPLATPNPPSRALGPSPET